MKNLTPMLKSSSLLVSGLTLLVELMVAPHFSSAGERSRMIRLPDTGQEISYTNTFGEDADYNLSTPSLRSNGDGTVTDEITGLIWQAQDGGEMTYENAVTYCDSLTLAGNRDWRLPTAHELFSIQNLGKLNPALDTTYFINTGAEYWWSRDVQVDDATKIWITNAGGGIGNHRKSETISAGGNRRIHVRAVRNLLPAAIGDAQFKDNHDGTITDNFTGLMWQRTVNRDTLTWEDALAYSNELELGGFDDWRLPNIKELQSLNDERRVRPSLDTHYFENVGTGSYWSSTTTYNAQERAWWLNMTYGITSYGDKVRRFGVICVRGEPVIRSSTPTMVYLPGGDFEMGDHHNFVDPNHPSDETPIHWVTLDSFSIGKFDVTNLQYCHFLESALAQNQIEIAGGKVKKTGDTATYCITSQFADYSSIAWDESHFSVRGFRANHPMVGVMWYGAAAYCNWLSSENGLDPCYNLDTWACDFGADGYRLPTEAEWEYSGRGGQYNPYYMFPWGNDSTTLSRANWPNSGDPFEPGSDPHTTPVGFYDGDIHYSTEFDWPARVASYQTANGSNPFGLFDMAGNVWQLINDWYGNDYYRVSPRNNPRGPDAGFRMPDGKTYRGMRGGNWYNGQWGHSRVSNRNPSYYRGPQDPNHPWYHIGFRIASSSRIVNTVRTDESVPSRVGLLKNYPNPFNSTTTIRFELPLASHASIEVYDLGGHAIRLLYHGQLSAGVHDFSLDGKDLPAGEYYCVLKHGEITSIGKMILLK